MQPTCTNNRITSTNIFGLVGSAIGQHALAMLKAKKDEKAATIIVDEVKKNRQAKEKKARDTTALGPRHHRLRDPKETIGALPFQVIPSKNLRAISTLSSSMPNLKLPFPSQTRKQGKRKPTSCPPPKSLYDVI